MADIYFKKTRIIDGEYWRLISVRNVEPEKRGRLGLECREYQTISGDIGDSRERVNQALAELRDDMKAQGHRLHMEESQAKRAKDIIKAIRQGELDAKKRSKKWSASDQVGARPIGNGLSVLEFQDNDGEWHSFDVLQTPTRILFGGYCNVGFLESGYIEREEYESLDKTLQELLSDLEVYYNDGPRYVSRIVCNDRM